MNAVVDTQQQDDGSSPLHLGMLDSITDFYVWDIEDLEDAVDSASAFFGIPHAHPVGGTSIAPWLRMLLLHVRNKHAGMIDFRVEYEHNGKTYLFRGHRDQTVTHVLLCLRRHPTITPYLDELAFENSLWRDLFLRSALLRGGLILIAAVTGQGKSTTLASIVKTRLKQFGGYCRTIEDPPELPLHGTHGSGLCMQTPVDPAHGEAGFAMALRAALRSYPALPSGGTILVVGEVRDGETAAELLRASVNGHLVLASIHAGDVQTAVARLAAMAETAMGKDVARDLLASGLAYAIHQKLIFRPQESGWRRGQVGGTILVSTSSSSAVASTIREGRFANLSQPIELQQNNLKAVKSVDEFIKRIDGDKK